MDPAAGPNNTANSDRTTSCTTTVSHSLAAEFGRSIAIADSNLYRGSDTRMGDNRMLARKIGTKMKIKKENRTNRKIKK